MSGLSLFKLKDRTHFVEIMFLQWAKYLFVLIARKSFFAREICANMNRIFVFHRVKRIMCAYVRLAKEKQRLVFHTPATINNSESNLEKTVTEMAPKTLRINK